MKISVVLLLLLSACQVLDHEGGDRADLIAMGTPVDLHRDLTLPPGQAGVFIPGTRIGDRYRYDAHCRLEVRTVSETPQTVVADHFIIERVVQEWERFTLRETGLRQAHFDVDGPALLLFTTVLYLHSDRQPDVFRLVCGHLQDSAQNPRYLTADEIRTVLAPVMTLHRPPPGDPTVHPASTGRWFPLQSQNERPLRRGHGQHRQPVAPAQQGEITQGVLMALQFGQGYLPLQAPDEPHVYPIPARAVRRAAGIVIGTGGIERSGVRITFPHHFDDPDDPRMGRPRVVEKGFIAQAQPVPQEVAGLIVAHPFPRRRSLRSGFQVGKAKDLGFGFQQPVAHYSPTSV